MHLMGLIKEAARWRKGWRAMPKKTVLVVDDDPAILETLRSALEDKRYRVLAAVGRDAVYTALSEQPDVILLDLIMLAEDGIHISERLHAMRETADIPIVAVSTQERLQALAPGLPVVDQLAKPFDLEQLYATVARWAEEL